MFPNIVQIHVTFSVNPILSTSRLGSQTKTSIIFHPTPSLAFSPPSFSLSDRPLSFILHPPVVMFTPLHSQQRRAFDIRSFSVFSFPYFPSV
uniref:Ovule protein n=1 Tax=Caenorhabditis tropicalis TaxID=1561998 RepID=A0A1I7TUY7_9PELO